jgi:uncharacterized protein (DUF2461 family)
MSKKGMDPDAVEQMGRTIEDAGQGVEDAYTKARNAVNELEWTGDDRERFLTDFESQVGDLVTNVRQGLDDLAERARTNATEQREASS